jgi:S-disulfanyl-L-cysteine oxidoreductase SoxD
MSMRKLLPAALFALGIAAAHAADTPKLGKPISEADIKAWDITILPDGTNLPPGQGTAAEGAKLFVEKGCIGCHGEGAKGATNMALVGKPPIDRIEATKTIANFWANSTTLYDTIRRSMPWPTPRTLNDSEVYALTAYILSLNKIIGENDAMNADTLPKVKMPNHDNFIIRFPERL